VAGGLYQTLRGSGQRNLIFVLLSPFGFAILLLAREAPEATWS